MVTNLRHRTSDYGEACKNAYNGIYDGTSSNAKKFSITNENYGDIESSLNDYRTNYHSNIFSLHWLFTLLHKISYFLFKNIFGKTK